jgi:TetR/AcrR family transcriptional regulator, mexCD-oprJ operon repressor
MQKNRERIIQTALKSLAKNPMATMDQIAELAGIGRATLYRHFSSREKLIQDLMVEAVKQFSQIVLPVLNDIKPAQQKLEQVITQLIPLGASFHFLMYEPWHTENPEIEHAYQDQLKSWRRLIKQLKDEQVIKYAVSETWIAMCLDALIFTAWDAIHSGDIAPNDAPNLVLQMFLKGIG